MVQDQLDYNLQVLRGLISGHSMVIINGHNGTSTTTNTTISPGLTTAQIVQEGMHTTPAKVKVASTSTTDDSAGNGLKTIMIVGLDTDGNPQTEIISMDGTSEVESVNVYSAINGMVGKTWGSEKNNAGIIWCGVGTFTTGEPATRFSSMEAGANSAMTAYYTVPTGFSLYIRQLNFWVVANKDVQFFIQKSTDDVNNWITAAIIGQGQGVSNSDVIGIPPFSGGDHLRICALSSAMDTELTAIFGCQLISDTTVN